MKRFVLIVNEMKDHNLEETKKLCSYIEAKGGTCQYLVNEDEQESLQKSQVHDMIKDAECILVLGGDGTLIRAARDTVAYGIPLIGINMGTLGYLCELEVSSACQGIDCIMQDAYMLEERMMLSGMQLGVTKKEVMPCRALNDIVIHRTGALSLVSLIVYVNGKYLNTFKGDGIILSTPTGSTGYNLSAGGPVVDPKAQLILLTPINSHMFSPKSIVLDAQDEIVIEIGSRRMQKDEIVEVSFDGDRGYRLEVGECIQITRAKEKTRILKFSEISFLEILRKKMEAYH